VIRPNGEEFTFELDSFKKHCLLNGLDKIGLTLDKEDKISSFEKERSKNYPWLDGASMKVPEKVAMYADAPINVAA
jgi:3-isopropylmalate dehydratase